MALRHLQVTGICLEDPGYFGAQRAFRASPAAVFPIAVDSAGVDVTAIRGLGERVQMVYVTPSHQYPLGVSMTAERRMDLLDWAARGGAWIIEDDYDSEFRYASRPLGALQGMDRDRRVIYLGTFTKVLFLGLRLGYLVVPHELIPTFLELRRDVDLFPPPFFQRVLTDFLRDGDFARHLRRMRRLYLARRNALTDAINAYAGDLLTVGNTDAGLHLVAFLPEGIDDLELVLRAEQLGMFPRALSSCYAVHPAPNGLLMGFAGTDQLAMAQAVRTLSTLIRELLSAQMPVTLARPALHEPS
jgi:GntR family transcriptional regulator/MocR family aminotransferase